MIKEKVLFLGNGINRIGNGYPWEKLLKDLIQESEMSGNIEILGKPFPLLYEEIYLKTLEKSKKEESTVKSEPEDKNEPKTKNEPKFKNESDIKSFIAKCIANISPNKVHAEIVNCKFEQILTTNYDYTLERSFPGGIESAADISTIKERKYSILRCRKTDETHIWHIHGEQDNPNSLTLGHEQYSGYLQQIRNYVVSGLQYEKTNFPPLIERLKARKKELQSWIDLFFLKNIYILGFNLDFAEIHLWWLLTYLAREKYENKECVAKNTITYIYPSSEGKKIMPRLQLLKAAGVVPKEIELDKNDWETYYKKALDSIASS